VVAGGGCDDRSGTVERSQRGHGARTLNDPSACSDSSLSAKPSLSTTGVGREMRPHPSSTRLDVPRVGSLTVRMPVYSTLPGIQGGAGATDVNRST
jgi:hypothetical protein